MLLFENSVLQVLGFSMGLGTDCNDMFNQLSRGKLNPSYG